jgi:hypothetical protein
VRAVALLSNPTSVQLLPVAYTIQLFNRWKSHEMALRRHIRVACVHYQPLGMLLRSSGKPWEYDPSTLNHGLLKQHRQYRKKHLHPNLSFKILQRQISPLLNHAMESLQK